jgi:hypothetical protein
MLFRTRNRINALEYRIAPVVQFLPPTDYEVNSLIYCLAEQGNSVSLICEIIKEGCSYYRKQMHYVLFKTICKFYYEKVGLLEAFKRI